MPFYRHEDLEAKQLIPGFEVRFVHGDSMTLAYWNIDASAKLPEHSHRTSRYVMLSKASLSW